MNPPAGQIDSKLLCFLINLYPPLERIITVPARS